MKLTMRPYQDQDDYWRIRAFLRRVFLHNDRRDLSWQVARLDYWLGHVIANCDACEPIGDVTFIWETASGQIGAVVNPEGRGEAFLQVDPALRSRGLEEAMIAVAEEKLAATGPDGGHKLRVWAIEGDDLRQDILTRRGYIRGRLSAYQRRRSLETPISEAPLAPGYTVRALGDVDELPARSWVSWRAFHPDEPDDAYQGWEWYHSIQRIPLYRRDLDIVAVAPDGAHASFCTIWYDDVTRSGYFEPVGTAPEHQRRGLGKAVMCEGLRRLKELGATQATVHSYETPAHALYASAGFTEYDVYQPWIREF
jgi:GNAT superfamily N-acetyltransferase